jgi:hypothetical protein
MVSIRWDRLLLPQWVLFLKTFLLVLFTAINTGLKVVQSSLETEDLAVAVSWHSRKIKLDSVDLINTPVLAQLMQNGRLASIAVAELQVPHPTRC